MQHIRIYISSKINQKQYAYAIFVKVKSVGRMCTYTINIIIIYILHTHACTDD
jgi:hypothetical protein